MMIESYSFGKIVIDGVIYNNDVIIFPDRVQDGWWRKEGHRIHQEDLKAVVEYSPNVLIIGSGAYGRVTVPDRLHRFLKENNIDLKVEKTERACETYNELSSEGDVVAALHLTC